MEINLLQQLGVALGLGLLVGFQREWGLPHVAGIRSFAMIPPLVLFALVILPILPNQTYGPYDVFNPFHAWAMVVLIVGISVIGFMTYKLFGARAGTLLNGLLGGVISSTATTVGYAQRTSKNPDMGKTAAVIIMIASTVVFFRVSSEVFVVGPEVLPHLAPLLAVMVAFMGAICAVLYLSAIEQHSIPIPTTNPSNLKAAIVFGVLYVAVLFAVAAAKKHCSESGLYLVAALSGLTEMDAITLSATNLIKSGNLSMDTGCRMILVGALSNILFKGGIVALLGSKPLFKRISTAFVLSIACGGALVIFWPKIG